MEETYTFTQFELAGLLFAFATHIEALEKRYPDKRDERAAFALNDAINKVLDGLSSELKAGEPMKFAVQQYYTDADEHDE